MKTTIIENNKIFLILNILSILKIIIPDISTLCTSGHNLCLSSTVWSKSSGGRHTCSIVDVTNFITKCSRRSIQDIAFILYAHDSRARNYIISLSHCYLLR